MNKKSKLAILASTLAVIGAFGYTAYAADNHEITSEPEQMLDRAVENGIITEEKKEELKNFTKEQMRQMMQEKMEKKLNQAVEDGTITSEEAQEIRDWQALRPEAMKKLKPIGKFGNKKGRPLDKKIKYQYHNK